MALHALRDVEDAVGVTRSFLLPFDARRWLKLALVVFFVGSGGSNLAGSSRWNQPPGSVGTPGGPSPDLPVGVDVLALVLAVVLLVVVLGLAYAVVSAVMEFVFVESLRSGEVTIRRYWRRRWRQGLRLFAFRVVLFVPLVVLFGIGLLAFLVGVGLLGGTLPSISGLGPLGGLLAVVVLVPVGILYAFVAGVVSTLTTVFVVPVMLLEDEGVLAGWRRLWPTLRASWTEFLVYLVVEFVVALVLGLVATTVVGIVAVLAGLPLVLLGVALFQVVSLTTPVGVGLVLLGVLVVGGVLMVVWAVLQVPIQTFLRSYALLVLGDVAPAFDLIPDRRAAVRAGD